jgi:hypothetical protein
MDKIFDDALPVCIIILAIFSKSDFYAKLYDLTYGYVFYETRNFSLRWIVRGICEKSIHSFK